MEYKNDTYNSFIDIYKYIETKNYVLAYRLYDEINNTIENNFVMLNKYVNENIIHYLDRNLNKTVDELKTEINAIKTSFNSYKNETNTLIETLKSQNETIEQEFKKSIEYNAKIISMFNEFKSQNADVEKFMNDFMTKWYKEYVSIFGMKKNKKD